METGTNPTQHPTFKEADLAHGILQKIVAGAYLDLNDNRICIDGWIPINDEELNCIRKIAAELS
jgi:hypothetical protein